MPEEVYPGLFRIEAPLPGNPLKNVNSWLVTGKERNLLIDNGFNMPVCHEVILAGLHQLGIALESLDFFITHCHSDHNGLTAMLAHSQSRIFCGFVDGNHINNLISSQNMWKEEIGFLKLYGFPETDLEIVAATHPGRAYANRQPLNFITVSDGDILEYGQFQFQVIHTPGHTPGHMTLYEKKHSFLISGDHILGSITPHITIWPDFTDSLGAYLRSLERFAALDIAITFPGHRENISNIGKRIKEILEHHSRRLAEVKNILASGPATAWQAARAMTWKGSWLKYHPAQKFFAVGEAAAHLEHLVAIGEARRYVNDQENIEFFLK